MNEGLSCGNAVQAFRVRLSDLDDRLDPLGDQQVSKQIAVPLRHRDRLEVPLVILPDLLHGHRRHPHGSVRGQAGLVGDDDQLDPVGRIELGEKPGHIRLDRGHADDELIGDLRVGHAAPDQAQHLAFPLGDAVRPAA